MFVCICRVVTESRIRSAISSGASTVDDIERACGAGGDCGSCRDEIQAMIDGESPVAEGCAGCPRAGQPRGLSRSA
ncbi:MAG: (2Fe-2S)-binding protein [Deltaproteobacteria bacterium]|nr:(2Fe-2S)-binding protein [Deltaproteobacteria bacterium]